jgi:hypothetical protein
MQDGVCVQPWLHEHNNLGCTYVQYYEGNKLDLQESSSIYMHRHRPYASVHAWNCLAARDRDDLARGWRRKRRTKRKKRLGSKRLWWLGMYNLLHMSCVIERERACVIERERERAMRQSWSGHDCCGPFHQPSSSCSLACHMYTCMKRKKDGIMLILSYTIRSMHALDQSCTPTSALTRSHTCGWSLAWNFVLKSSWTVQPETNTPFTSFSLAFGSAIF